MKNMHLYYTKLLVGIVGEEASDQQANVKSEYQKPPVT
jgi:hypothetical protein